jgi:fatty acid-binding protein DegV
MWTCPRPTRGHAGAYDGPQGSVLFVLSVTGAFAQEFRRAANSIAVVLSSKLSGTYNSAVSAMKGVLSEDPLRKIHVIDSRATPGRCFADEAPARADLPGSALEEYCFAREHYRDQMRVLFTLSSFDISSKRPQSRAAE